MALWEVFLKKKSLFFDSESYLKARTSLRTKEKISIDKQFENGRAQ